MTGRVFVSCGQRPAEAELARRVKAVLEDEFGLDAYVAKEIHGLNDVSQIIDELRVSDYYVFVDFRRDSSKDGCAVSIFTHQELALAYHLGFEEIIPLQQEGLESVGLLRYFQTNPVKFRDEDDLLQKLRGLVRELKWSREYSRNLVVTLGEHQPLVRYADHTGEFNSVVVQARVENRRPDVAAVGTVCVLDAIRKNGEPAWAPNLDRSYLKWSGQMGFERTILPRDFAIVDALAVGADRHGVYLHSASDAHPRAPIIMDDGFYELRFKLFSTGFPLVKFVLELDYRKRIPNPVTGDNLDKGARANVFHVKMIEFSEPKRTQPRTASQRLALS